MHLGVDLSHKAISKRKIVIAPMKALVLVAFFCASIVAGVAQPAPQFKAIGANFLAHAISGDGNKVVGEVDGKPATWDPILGVTLLAVGPDGTGYANDVSFDGSVITGVYAGNAVIWRAGVPTTYDPGFALVSDDGKKWVQVIKGSSPSVQWHDDSTGLTSSFGGQNVVAISGDGEIVYVNYQNTPWVYKWLPRTNESTFLKFGSELGSTNLHGEQFYGNKFQDYSGSDRVDTDFYDFTRMLDLGKVATFLGAKPVQTYDSDDDSVAACLDLVYFPWRKATTSIYQVITDNGLNNIYGHLAIKGISADGLTLTGVSVDYAPQTWVAKIGLYGKSDIYQVVPNQTLRVPAPGVLGNDPYTFNGKAVLVQTPAHGTVTLKTDGGFSYTPQANYLGRDTFTYKIAKGTSTSDPITVVLKAGVPASITLTPNAVAGGGKVSAKVVLNFVAFAPVSVAVKATKPSLVVMPSSVTVPAGQRFTSFAITTTSPATSSSTTIIATLDEVSVTANLTVAASGPKALTMDPPVVLGGLKGTAHGTLWKPAPAGGVTVNFSSSNPAVASVPSGFNVPAGAQSFDIPISTVKVHSGTDVTITASALGSQASAVLRVRTPTIASVVLTPDTVVSGGTVDVAVTMDAVPVYNYYLTVGTLRHSLVNVQTAHFTYHAQQKAVDTTVDVVVAGDDGTTIHTPLRIKASSLTGLKLDTNVLIGGGATNLRGVFDGPPDIHANINLSSSNPDVVSVPAYIVSNSYATVSSVPVSADTTVTISGTYKGKTQTISVVVIPARLNGLSLNPSSVKGGYNTTGTVTLDGAAGPGGAKVLLSISDATVGTLPSSVTIPAGQSSATFTIVTKPVTQNRSATVKGTKASISQTATLTVTP